MYIYGSNNQRNSQKPSEEVGTCSQVITRLLGMESINSFSRIFSVATSPNSFRLSSIDATETFEVSTPLSSQNRNRAGNAFSLVRSGSWIFEIPISETRHAFVRT